MIFDLQNMTVAVLVLAAAGYLGYRGWSIVAGKKSGGCGSSCTACPTDTVAGGEPAGFVAVDELTKSKPR